MKKLSSMLALSLALVLVLGMTVFAAGSPDTENNPSTGTGTETPGTGTETPGTGTETPGTGTETPGTGTETPGTGTETPGTGTETPGTGTETPGTGTETPGTGSTPSPAPTPGVITGGVTVAEPNYSEISDAANANYQQWLYEGITVGGETVEVEPVTAMFELEGDVPADGNVTLTVEGITYEDSATTGYFALHLEGDEWVRYEVTVNENGTVTIHNLRSFSPFVILAYDRGDVPDESPSQPDVPTNNGGSGSTTSDTASGTADAATSPKTGETAPIAMLIALVSLAGVSVLSGKRAFSVR